MRVQNYYRLATINLKEFIENVSTVCDETLHTFEWEVLQHGMQVLEIPTINHLLLSFLTDENGTLIFDGGNHNKTAYSRVLVDNADKAEELAGFIKVSGKVSLIIWEVLSMIFKDQHGQLPSFVPLDNEIDRLKDLSAVYGPEFDEWLERARRSMRSIYDRVNVPGKDAEIERLSRIRSHFTIRPDLPDDYPNRIADFLCRQGLIEAESEKLLLCFKGYEKPYELTFKIGRTVQEIAYLFGELKECGVILNKYHWSVTRRYFYKEKVGDLKHLYAAFNHARTHNTYPEIDDFLEAICSAD